MVEQAADVKFSVELSRGFTPWFAELGGSLALSTYQVGKIIFLGLDKDDKLWVHNRNVGRCLGLTTAGDGFWAATDSQLYRFENVLEGGQLGKNGEDAVFAPRFSYFTGDLDAHDIGADENGEPIFVNTLFNCLARPHRRASFEPAWVPPFISRLALEDRCHLNGLAMRDGKPAYVTAISTSDTYNGWRDHRRDGGVVIDVESAQIIASGLSMPHSPRWHNDKLWVLNSGHGEFGSVDLQSGEFEPLAFCPGYLRGLAFMGNYAVIGLSLPRDNKTFSGLPLDDALSERRVEPKCGLYFVDLQSGDVKHSIEFGGLVTELYDVAVLDGIRQPSAISPLSDDMKRAIVLPQGSAL